MRNIILTTAYKQDPIISFFQYSLTFNITSITFYYSLNKKNYYKTKFFIFLHQTFLFFSPFQIKNILTFFLHQSIFTTISKRNRNEIVYHTNPYI
jgi:DNA replication protein DnaD